MIGYLERHLIPCFFKSHFGMTCPGCGMQRAFISLLKGNFSESVHYHAALIPLLSSIFIVIMQLILKKENGSQYIMWAFIITGAITLIQFVIRQVLFFN